MHPLKSPLKTDWPYDYYLIQDDEGKTGPFLEAFKKQMKSERSQYVEAIRDQLKDTKLVKFFNIFNKQVGKYYLILVYIIWSTKCFNISYVFFLILEYKYCETYFNMAQY